MRFINQAKAGLLSTVLAAVLATTAQAVTELNKEKLAKVFPTAEIVSTKELRDGYFEVQVIEDHNIIKKTHFYTNHSVDFIAPSFVFVNSDNEVGIEKPNFEYDSSKLDKHKTFEIGSGPVAYHFINPMSETGLAALEEIFEGNGKLNKVIVYFDQKDPVQMMFSLPIYYGDNENRINEAKKTFDIVNKITSLEVQDEEASRIMENRILEIQKSSSKETLNEMGIAIQVSIELKDIYSKDSDYVELSTDLKKMSKEIISFDQEIETYDFTEYGEDLKKALADATAYKIGSGENKFYLFSDIDCPYCVKLDRVLHSNLRDDVNVSVLLFPIQSLHEKALDKTRYVLSVPEGDRDSEAQKIMGDAKSAYSSRVALSKLDEDRFSAIDRVVSMSHTLANLLQVSGTPTVMAFDGNKIRVIKPEEYVKLLFKEK